MNNPASIAGQMEFLLDEARSSGWVPRSWTISDLDLQQLREEVGADLAEDCFGGLPCQVSEDDSEPLTLHGTRAVSQR